MERNNDERRGNILRERTLEENLEIRAGEQMFGRGTWTYVQDDALHIGPVPPREAWGGKKETALASARVHEIMEQALRPVMKALTEVREALEVVGEDMEDEIEETGGERAAISDLLCADTELSRAAYRLRGIMRDGFDHDDMDTHAPSLFAAVFDELRRGEGDGRGA